ncbi:MAG TPA: GHMP kinase [Roseiflexaceae bacterium]
MIIARAPARISFGGGGTDLESYYAAHGGLVVSAAIARYCYVRATEPPDRRIRLFSADYGVAQTFEPGMIPAPEQPLSLPKAAIGCFAGRGLCERGVDLVLSSDLPPGTGLGSSSAMAVALVRALAAYTGTAIDAAGAAALACAIEIDRLGMPIGRQDQYASAFGGLNSILFTASGVRVEPIELPPDAIAALSRRLLLFSTGQRRDSAGILRQQQRDSAGSPAVIESLHRIKGLALEIRAALLAGDLDRFGQLLDQSWQIKRCLSDKISSSAIDRWYATARRAGALGGKIAGAGGGGFLMLYCPPARQPALREAMARSGLSEMPFDFELAGARLLYQEGAAQPVPRAREAGAGSRPVVW